MYPRHELHSYVEQAISELSSEYERISKRSREDAGTAGDEGEENWAQLLRDWLPANYHVVTKGRVLSARGIASGQMDVLILYPTYPKGLLNKKLYLGPGVAAAFECKLTLRGGHVARSIEKGAILRRILQDEYENYPPPIYGILAHSHAWKSPDHAIADRLVKSMHDADMKYAQDPFECLDVLCLAPLGTWTLMRYPIIEPGISELQTVTMGPTWHPHTKESQSIVSPVGRFLSYLLRRIALNDRTLYPIGRYLQSAGLVDIMAGSPRKWPKNTLPENSRDPFI